MKNTITHSPSRQSLADKAYRLLAEQIVTLQLQPGQLLIEKELIEMTGIGRTPVREAIQRLAAAGLLQVLPRKGLMVTVLSRSGLMMMLEARKVLERLMVVKAAERATPDQRRALQTMAAHITALGDDLGGFQRLDTRLYEVLGLACKNSYLVGALAPIRGQCRRLWHLQNNAVDHSRVTYLHGALTTMVAEGDGAGAIRALDGIIAILEELINHLDILG
ncbi:MAG: GntR family transcriptional regulator [Xanthomonadales bacterium]|nr:GntR family transcriptional regulator [Xanthomonadales bacterium]